jgi:hypothetical protein
VLGTLVLLAGSAGAAPDEETRRASSYWHMSFLGGVVRPLGKMTRSHEQGLVVGGRFGWTSKVGLGLDLAGSYSPLPRAGLPELESYEIHYATGTLGPRMTLGRRTLRVWIAGGGGVAFERAKRLVSTVPVETTSEAAPIAAGAAGIELHFTSSGGLSVTGGYQRTFRDLRYEYYDVKAGLVFTF